MSTKRITQATFDEAVEENMREFGMIREEAVADAVVQFEAAGVTLDGIVRDGTDSAVHPVISAVRCLKQWAVDRALEDLAAVQTACNRLVAECARNGANKQIARSNGGVTFVSAAVVAGGESNIDDVRKCTIEALRALCANSDDCRNEVDPKQVVPVILNACRPESRSDVRRSALLCAAVLCVKREGVKTALFDGGLPDILLATLQHAAEAETAPLASSDSLLVREACIALSRLLTDDDMSILASNAYAYARQLAGSGVAVTLLTLLAAHNADDMMSAEIYSALRSVTVNEDVCRQVDAAGGIESITIALGVHASMPIRVSAASLGLGGGARRAGGLGAGSRLAGSLPSVVEEGDGSLGVVGGEEEGEEGAAADPSSMSFPRDASGDATSTTGDNASIAEDPAEANSVLSEGGSAGSAAGAAGVVAAALAAAAAATAGDTETSVQRRIRVLRCGLAVLRTLANSDPNKVKMGEGSTLGLLLQVLESAADVPPVLDQAVAALGNLCLRLTSNAEKIVARGGLPLLARVMQRHPNYLPLQRSACLTLRNLVSRSPERVRAAFEEGFEQLLQAAYMRHTACRDVAYACLRDMGCSYAETAIGRAQAERAARAIAANNIAIA